MSAVRNYLIVTGAYWGFTLTDGALRMLVLLHFYQLGYTPFTLAFLFLLYEAAGIFANLGGGWLASKFGIPRMLAIGLTLQIGGLLMLSALDPAWSAAASVAWVVCAQGISGVAKDLTKTASKSAIKASSQQGAGQLFRWVAWFTGSKNAMKGFGFFLGGFLLQAVGFRPALWLLVLLLAVALVGVLLSLPRELGKAKASKSFKELFAKNRGVNLLAGARVFMFGSRDVWFVVGLPVFLYSQGWNYVGVSTFLAAWTIGYGGVQALAPQVVRRSPDGLSREVPEARLWGVALAIIPIALGLMLATGAVGRPDLVVVAGLAIFGFAFAVNSSLHSYLILAYAGSEKAAEDVGFYYAANAAGRLFGILLSGVLTQYAGLQGCLWGSAAMLATCAALTFMLPMGAGGRQVAA
ncbi:organoarsenical effux MFS transporter ArsJ [Pseudoroseomonas ludipueritiae]|uniref:Organoarsenical effux MFS transporter ArsJ n=1 Tax=Pseudoroseomonas ludipueritiae TaxID=198093 RepID=A0ABR7R2M1_9PROT|nr:organoarsenical effux MFS transporter ArsJ [Pseudoroseomonas ludipueritiae]MBC9175984.1 organoarsenical effux MFS transporter ArsJ [Pseudoroseomonas ludipueritiae]